MKNAESKMQNPFLDKKWDADPPAGGRITQRIRRRTDRFTCKHYLFVKIRAFVARIQNEEIKMQNEKCKI